MREVLRTALAMAKAAAVAVVEEAFRTEVPAQFRPSP